MSKNVETPVKKLQKIWENSEFNRFGLICVSLLMIGCMGGAAAAFGAGENTLKLALTVFPTIITLALILGVAHMNLIIRMSFLAVIIDILILLF